MIEQILPAAAASAEAFTDSAGAALFPEEQALVARAVDKRRVEFATGRMCARAALAKLGLPATPILRGERGAPQWPDVVTGSITHCAGYRAAAVAHSRDLAGIGIDAEPNEPLPNGVLDAIALDEELAWLRALPRTPYTGPAWDRLLFCAKEAVYKTWFPLTGRPLGFHEALITVDAAAGVFDARLLLAGPTIDGRRIVALSGRWLATETHVLTVITVPAHRSDAVTNSMLAPPSVREAGRP